MDERESLARRFEENRAHLRAVAYRMLGSLDEADDAVQEAWIRLSRPGTGTVENLRGWLTTVVGRVCLETCCARVSRGARGRWGSRRTRPGGRRAARMGETPNKRR